MTENETGNSADDADAYKKGRDIALRRLGRRECSTGDLRRKITEQGISAEIAESIVADLARVSFVDDERFSRMLIRQQVSQSKGPRLIRQKLREQGINLSIEQVSSISSEVIDTSEAQRARSLVERKYPAAFEDKKIAARASQALLRRGFSYDVISKALKTRSALDE